MKQKIVDFIRQKYPIILIILAIIVALIFNPYNTKKDQSNINAEDFEQSLTETPKFYRTLDGVEVESEELINDYVVALMVENNSESWPLSGLDSMSIVYEALAEGRIPRFVSFAPLSEMPDEIGPVRSARKYFVELAAQFKPLYVHVGGSPESLETVKKLPLIDVDEFSAGAYFTRSSLRRAPHNTYISQEQITRLIERREIAMREHESWSFKDPLKISETKDLPTFDVIINYTDNTYQAKYIYFPLSNRFQRYQAKEPMIMRDGSEIWADTVVVQEHRHVVLDSVGRRRVDLIGEGRAWVFQDGQVIEAKWSKENDTDLTRYLDSDGNEITFNRGKIWINLVELNSFTPPTQFSQL